MRPMPLTRRMRPTPLILLIPLTLLTRRILHMPPERYDDAV